VSVERELSASPLADVSLSAVIDEFARVKKQTQLSFETATTTADY